MEDRLVAELIHRTLDGDLTDSEFQVLNELLREDPAVAWEFARAAHLHNQLHDRFAVKLPAITPIFRTKRHASYRSWFVGAVCATVLGALGSMAFWYTPHQPLSIGVIVDRYGDVRVENADGDARLLEVTPEIYSGDRIVASGMNTDVTLRLHDGSQLALQGNAAVRCGNEPEPHTFYLDAGQVAAMVAPQKIGHPLRIATSTAVVEVLGTAFTVWTTSDRTEVDVAEGRVAVTSTDESQSLQVAPGQRAVATADRGLRVEDRPAPAHHWETDFENGIPAGWHADPVSHDLPSGSVGAARAKYDPNYGGHFIVGVRGGPEGLFEITPTSHIHVTFKVADRSPRWLNFFLFTGSRDDTGSNFTSHKSMAMSESHPRPGVWQTMTIPLTDFHSLAPTDRDPHAWTGPSPRSDDVPLSLTIGAPPPDRGLIVDRIWVTSDGPGHIVLEPAN